MAKTKLKKSTKSKATRAVYNNLLIVESPSKAKTINKYLGSDYKVLATVGHIIDLPKSKLGVDIDNGYEPLWEQIYGKGKIVKDLKKSIPKGGNVYLAMDPDREGEAIAWHTANSLGLKEPKRVTFHEITQDAVKEAISKPQTIDIDLVNAQKARRVLDRLVGYKLSEILWKKIWYGLSAGRVQSVALRLIVEKEEEREAFDSEEYWEVKVVVKDNRNNLLEAKLQKKDEKKYIPKNKQEVEELEERIGNGKFVVKNISKKKISKHAFPPFTTSTLQQSAYNGLGFTSKRTMALAQQLYQSGYVTYMRTDSVYLGAKAIESIRKLVQERFGKEYIPEKPNFYKTKSKNAQEAHEAIRPTDFWIDSKRISSELGDSAAKLYELIWKRAVSSQMSSKEVEVLSVSLTPRELKSPEYEFLMGGERILFEGFRKVLFIKHESEDLQEINQLEKGDELTKEKFINEQKFTQPPARFTEASLIKKLEELGIGRPSTYATIISTILARGYVVKDGRAILPVDVGRLVTNFLRGNFTRLVDYAYTAQVEDELDSISLGKKKYFPVIDEEFKMLTEAISKAEKDVKKDDVVIIGKSEEKCPKCGGEMVVRVGRYGRFLSCAKFPECKGMKDISGGIEIDFEKYEKQDKCPKCGKSVVLKSGKYGKFWACEEYPDCKGVIPLLLKEKCPECGHNLVERRSKWGKTFIGCSNYPECKYIKNARKSISGNRRKKAKK
ncbi:type I DNA topoisomerase [Candidatus Dojkabacteria bacterium]|uniref:DNA topoisomerase 1 n=1 Tax=Candidatus Dojkabacteria bacterium TaxID=2099670 RepID=A0A847D033_9BACT|nr:type I DNA topoisomerase [Candidatus Dojkabacteria bacterium]